MGLGRQASAVAGTTGPSGTTSGPNAGIRPNTRSIFSPIANGTPAIAQSSARTPARFSKPITAKRSGARSGTSGIATPLPTLTSRGAAVCAAGSTGPLIGSSSAPPVVAPVPCPRPTRTPPPAMIAMIAALIHVRLVRLRRSYVLLGQPDDVRLPDTRERDILGL